MRYMKTLFLVLFLLLLGNVFAVMEQDAEIADRQQSPTKPAQIRLCMVGDSITWWNFGDYWRKCLVEEIPALAFVGEHTAKYGYSHSGQGGDTIGKVLMRMDLIPDSEYYSLLLGTNNSASANENRDNDILAMQIKDGIIDITRLLLQKPSAKKVFVGSLLPCDLKQRPLQNVVNGKVNILLKVAINELFPDGNVVFVNYAPQIDDIDSQMCDRLHPSEEGYEILANVLGSYLKKHIDSAVASKLKYAPGSGVRVRNLWHEEYKVTRMSLPAGWYTFSFGVHKVYSDDAYVVFKSLNRDGSSKVEFKIEIEKDEQAKRKFENCYVFKTDENPYIESQFTVEMHDCVVTQILVEKMRPSKQPSIYSIGSYIDTVNTPHLGEFVEWGL